MDSHSLIYWPEMILVQLNRISLIVKWLHFPCPAISVDLQVANESFPQRLWMEEEQICGKPAFCNALGTMPGCLFTPTLSPHQNKTKWSVFPISPGYYSRPKRNRRQWLCKIFGQGALRSMWKRWKPEWALLTHSVKCVVQTLNASTTKTGRCKLERMHNSSREDWKKSVLSIFQNIPSFQSYRLLLFVSILR